MLLNEVRPVINPKLTLTQKTVLCNVFTSPTSLVAYEQTQTDDNTVQARELLIKMGILGFDEEGGLVVTSDGKEVMTREYLIDDTEELTDQGRDLIKQKDTPHQSSSSDVEDFSNL